MYISPRKEAVSQQEAGREFTFYNGRGSGYNSLHKVHNKCPLCGSIIMPSNPVSVNKI